VLSALLEAANAEQLALFLRHVCTGSTFGADTNLPMAMTAVIVVLDVVEVSRFQEHKLFELELLYG
jgi:hypothetical protein